MPSRNECEYDEVSALYWYIHHILSFCVALMIYFIRSFMGGFPSGKTFRGGKMVQFQFSECVFWDAGVINQQRVITTRPQTATQQRFWEI